MVFSFLKRRSWRKVTTWLLAVMQMHLLVVLVLHHHVLSRTSLELSTTTTSMGQADRNSLPAGGEQSYCTACQILRHSAVRPSLGNPTVYHSSVAPLLALSAAMGVLYAQPTAWHGRAPPLV